MPVAGTAHNIKSGHRRLCFYRLESARGRGEWTPALLTFHVLPTYNP